MSKHLLLSALLAVGVAGAPAAAQVDRHGMSEKVAAKWKSLPASLAGLSRDAGYDAPMSMYRKSDALSPVIAVVLTYTTTPISLRRAAELSRAEATRTGLIDTLFEGRFALPGQSDARWFFGDYVTQQGIKQSWIAEDDGVRLTVSATIYRIEDRRAVFDAIRNDLLGGAEMKGKVSPADVN